MYKIFCYARVYSNTERFYRESGKWLSTFGIWKKCINPNLHYLYLFRKAQKHQKKLFPGILEISPKTLSNQIRLPEYPETQIGEGLYLAIGVPSSSILKLRSVKSRVLPKG
jgi:hypothetical protein